MNPSDTGTCHVTSAGMFVQSRNSPANANDDAHIKIKVSFGSSLYDLSVPLRSTFGYVKKVLAHQTGLDTEDQRLIFRGREREDSETLQAAGVKELPKLLLMEHPASNGRRIEEMRKREEINKACEAVAQVRAEVDKLSRKIAALDAAVRGGTKVGEREFIVSTELLMRQLLKLDCIEAEGDAKLQRKNEVRRVQFYVDTLDALKARNSNPFADCSKSVSVTTQWETFDSGVGSLTPPSAAASTKTTQDWERFD